jgi:hypothetical protein
MKMKMKIENIDNTLEEIQEVGDQMRVINEAIAQPVGAFAGARPGGPPAPAPAPACHKFATSAIARPLLGPAGARTVRVLPLWLAKEEGRGRCCARARAPCCGRGCGGGGSVARVTPCCL